MAHGTPHRRINVAIIGSGPAGFYAADALLKHHAFVDLFERLPAPHGLVRYGVAPDHQKIKSAARAFEKTARRPGFRFFGNVQVGRDLSIAELRRAYDQVLITTGSAADKRLGIPGEDLAGSVSATELVGWYNGHPDFRHLSPPLDTKRVVVVGAGNVALDVARVLMRHPSELEPTDIAEHALACLEKSAVEEVVILARRGPAQAAFDLAELQDIEGLLGVDVGVEGELSGPSESHTLDRAAAQKVDYIRSLSRAHQLTAHRRVIIRFCASPVALVGRGRVARVRIERNELAPESGRPRGTGDLSTFDAGLVVRAIGYRGVPLPGVPFDEATGTIPNDRGRVLAGRDELIPGLYTAGWIKRGATGLIGTNKVCAKETVDAMLEDSVAVQAEGISRVAPAESSGCGVEDLLLARGARFVTYDDWLRLDEIERTSGACRGKIRNKIATVEDMLAALDGRPERWAANQG